MPRGDALHGEHMPDACDMLLWLSRDLAPPRAACMERLLPGPETQAGGGRGCGWAGPAGRWPLCALAEAT